jgi:hypothetical protein
MRLTDITHPIDRFVAFIEERESIRIRRASGKPWPWTQEPILQSYRFTNINRENDKVSKHYQETIRDRYGENPIVFPATVLYRWFNRMTTCNDFFNQPDLANRNSVFEQYIETGNLDILLDVLRNIPPPHVTGAFIVTGRPGHPKGEGVLLYFDAWCHKPWRDMWLEWRIHPPSLHTMDEWILAEGLGTFMRGQIVADLKYLPFMLNAPDWWTWATPGPGSMRGLNIVLERPMDSPWPKGQWLVELQNLNNFVSPMLDKIGIEKLHNQDLQNCLCEFSKFTKVARGVGRPRQIFRHGS